MKSDLRIKTYHGSAQLHIAMQFLHGEANGRRPTDRHAVPDVADRLVLAQIERHASETRSCLENKTSLVQLFANAPFYHLIWTIRFLKTFPG